MSSKEYSTKEWLAKERRTLSAQNKSLKKGGSRTMRSEFRQIILKLPPDPLPDESSCKELWEQNIIKNPESWREFEFLAKQRGCLLNWAYAELGYALRHIKEIPAEGLPVGEFIPKAKSVISAQNKLLKHLNDMSKAGITEADQLIDGILELKTEAVLNTAKGNAKERAQKRATERAKARKEANYWWISALIRAWEEAYGLSPLVDKEANADREIFEHLARAFGHTFSARDLSNVRAQLHEQSLFEHN